MDGKKWEFGSEQNRIFSNINVLRVFEKLEPDKWGIFKTSFLLCVFFLKSGTLAFSKNLKFSKYHVPAIQNELILS